MSKGLPAPAGSLLQAKGPPRVQEGSQEPGSQEAAESAAQGLGPSLSRKGGGQAAGVGEPDSYLLLLPGGSMGLDLSRGQAPWPGRAVPPPCHQTLLPSPSLEGGTEEAGPGQLGCRPDCNWKLCSFPCSPRRAGKSW